MSDLCVGVDLSDEVLGLLDLLGSCGIDLVDETDVCLPNLGLDEPPDSTDEHLDPGGIHECDDRCVCDLDIRQEPLGFHDYNCLQMNAFAVVSDSGTLPEESSFFTSVGHSFPAVCIRTSTERPEALDKGCFILAGINEHDLLQAVDVAVEMVRNGDNGIPVPTYTDENVSTKIVKLIQSYTGVVNKMVWRKE